MSAERPLRLAVVAGEESGDLLGANLVAALRSRLDGRAVELTGVGGAHLQQAGLTSLFDAVDIAIMGVTAVIKDLPRLLRRIRQTARAIVEAKPDCLVTIDSPEFSLRVAQKVRAADPSIPIVHYVCPSVWAWRPERAAKMKPHVDHVLCLLPFEPGELARLGGPPGTFVGHRLSRDPDVLAAASRQLTRGAPQAGGRHTLLLLPGSRRGEVQSLAGVFGETVGILKKRGHDFDVVVPTVPRLAPMIEAEAANWAVRPEITAEPGGKWRAFAEAHAALACSGTVTLELALVRVPFVLCYKTDVFGRLITRLIITWSAALPNLVAGWPVVPEIYNEFIRPEQLARHVEQLWADTPTRAAQRQGFARVAEALHTAKPSGEIAADIVLRHLKQPA